MPKVECKYLIYTCTQREENWAAYVNFGHFWLIPLTEAMNDNQNIKWKKIYEKKNTLTFINTLYYESQK